MKKSILTVLLALSLLLSCCVIVSSTENTLPFTDVKAGKWYYDAVVTVYNEGIMEGMREGIFAPSEDMTRAQLVTILSRLSYADTSGCAAGLTFKDTKKSAWYADAVGWAVSEGLVTGYTDNTFRPNAKVLRQELAVLLARFLAAKSITLPEIDDPATFADAAAIPAWAADGVDVMRRCGIVYGDEKGNFNPNKSASRAEIAAIITRMPRVEDPEIFNDVMDERLANAKDYFQKAESGDPLFVFTNAISEEIFAFRILVALQLNTATYSVEFENADDFFATLESSSYASLKNGEQMTFDGAKLQLHIKNNVTNEQTEKAAFEKIVLRKKLDDATSDNLGVLYADEELELKISNAIKMIDMNGEEITTCGDGVHGGHQARVVRTEYGTYGTYTMNDGLSVDAEDGLGKLTDEIVVFKVTSEGCKILYKSYILDGNNTPSPNIMTDGTGKVYVPIIGQDGRYWKTAESVAMGWLQMVVIEEQTETVTVVDNRYPYDTIAIDDHGYGKPQSIIDVEQGKIYACANGGSTSPGYIAWFIYDMATDTWEEECHTIFGLKHTVVYPNGYPDGNGGFYYIVQRCGDIKILGELLGVEFSQGAGYAWDALYIFHIKDAYTAEYEMIPVYEPAYSTTEPNKPYCVKHIESGCTYRDNNGNLHVIYLVKETPTKSKMYHAVYDAELNELYHDLLPTTYKKNLISSYGLTQATDGTYYMIVCLNDETNNTTEFDGATVEVWNSADGIDFKRIVNEVELKFADGTTLNKGSISIGNVRNNSLGDNVIPVFLNDYSYDPYCYFTVEISSKTK